jgi:membrane protein
VEEARHTFGRGSGAVTAAPDPVSTRRTSIRRPFGRQIAYLGRESWSVLGETYARWGADGAPRMAAALAYYTTLSLAPLLLVLIGVAGIVFGTEAVRGELVHQIDGITGHESARAIEDLLANARHPASGIIASAIGIVMLLVSASGVVGELENALNVIWQVAPAADSFRAMIVRRATSLAMLLGVGFLLLVSLALSAFLAAASRYAGSILPGNETVWMLLEVVASFAVITALFALLFKFLPDAPVRWSDVWIGAAATSAFFSLGKLLIGLYLGRSSIGSAYGAAGSLVVMLVWIYYAAQILLFGAELTHVYALKRADHGEAGAPSQVGAASRVAQWG